MDDDDKRELARLRDLIGRLSDRLYSRADLEDLIGILGQVRGRRGERGEPGEPGGRGPIGPEGPQGQAGRDGPSGPEGPRGPEGRTGDTGSDGSGGGRYWEAYLVRYFAGTLVGSIAVFSLLYEAPIFRRIEMPEKIVEALSSASGMENIVSLLILFIALGFAFSYIASAPAYTLHLYRCFLLKGNSRRSKWTREAKLVFLLFGFVVIASLLFTAFWPRTIFSTVAACLLLVIVVFAGLIPFALSMPDQSKIAKFYMWLSKERARGSKIQDNAKSDESDRAASTTEFIESYRHLREHGNAYLIVILNILLACVLSIATTIQFVALIIALWTLPAAMGWFVATKIERSIADVSK